MYQIMDTKSVISWKTSPVSKRYYGNFEPRTPPIFRSRSVTNYLNNFWTNREDSWPTKRLPFRLTNFPYRKRNLINKNTDQIFLTDSDNVGKIVLIAWVTRDEQKNSKLDQKLRCCDKLLIVFQKWCLIFRMSQWLYIGYILLHLTANFVSHFRVV